MAILLKINALEIAREVVYTNNAIVRTTERPDDVINKYNNQIKELQEKLSNVK
jgi:ribosomal protein S3